MEGNLISRMGARYVMLFFHGQTARTRTDDGEIAQDFRGPLRQ